MAVYASLLSTIPIPQQQWQTKSQTPVVASVNVGDVLRNGESSPVTLTDKSFGFLDRLKQSLIEKRLKKLESISPENRTPAQQAELDANKKALDYMV